MSDNIESSANTQFTRCPQCKTAFKVTEKLLSLAKGKVRCGACLAIFQADEYFVKPKAVTPTLPVEQSPAQNTIATKENSADATESASVTEPVSSNSDSSLKPESKLSEASPSPIEEAPTKDSSANNSEAGPAPVQSATDSREHSADEELSAGDFLESEALESERLEDEVSKDEGMQVEAFRDEAEEELSSALIPEDVSESIDLDSFELESDPSFSEFDIDSAELEEEPSEFESEASLHADQWEDETWEDSESHESESNDSQEQDPVVPEIEEQALVNEHASEFEVREPKVSEKDLAEVAEEEFTIPEQRNVFEEEGDLLGDILTETEASVDALEEELAEPITAEREELSSQDFDQVEDNIESESLTDAENKSEFSTDDFDESSDFVDSEDDFIDSDDVEFSGEQAVDPVFSDQDLELDSDFLADNLTTQMEEADTEPDPLDEFEERVEEKKTGLRNGIIAAVILILISLGGHQFWKNRQTLSWDPTWGSMTKSICGVLPCDLKPRRDIASLKLRQRIVEPSENDENKLDIKILLINNADFAQPYPRITINFSNQDGAKVATRQFEVKDYFPEKVNALIPAKAEVHLSFNTDVPHPDALGFEFIFD